jgi:hypothetical protein
MIVYRLMTFALQRSPELFNGSEPTGPRELESALKGVLRRQHGPELARGFGALNWHKG